MLTRYDAASRLYAVSDGTNSATYGHLANSPLVGQILLAQNGATRMTTQKSYDYVNRLTSISSTGAGSSWTYIANNPAAADDFLSGFSLGPFNASQAGLTGGILSTAIQDAADLIDIICAP